MGFEPMMRVLQTLALPLGDVAMDKTFWLAHMARCEPSGQPFIGNYQSGRWDSNPRPSPWQGDVLPLYYAREINALFYPNILTWMHLLIPSHQETFGL